MNGKKDLDGKKEISVLLIEDNLTYAQYVQSILQTSPYFAYEVKHVETAAVMRDTLEQETFDIVLLDLYLPNGEGEKLVRMVRVLAPKSVLIIVTGRGSDESEVATRQATADDYLVKGELTNELFLYKIRNWAIWITARKEAKVARRGLDEVAREMDDTIRTCETSAKLPPYP